MLLAVWCPSHGWSSPPFISRHALSPCGLAPRTGHRLLRICAAAADAAARRDRDEEVRREHRAICAFVREHTSAAETRSLTWAGEAAEATRFASS